MFVQFFIFKFWDDFELDWSWDGLGILRISNELVLAQDLFDPELLLAYFENGLQFNLGELCAVPNDLIAL